LSLVAQSVASATGKLNPFVVSEKSLLGKFSLTNTDASLRLTINASLDDRGRSRTACDLIGSN
jgi:hypothetical protein